MIKASLTALLVVLAIFVARFVYKRKPPAPTPKSDPALTARLNELLEKVAQLQTTPKLDDAETAYKEILQIHRKTGAEQDLAMTLNKMANLYSDMRRYTEAEAAYSEALEIYRRKAKADPEWQPYVARTLSNFATFCLLTRQNGRAGRMGDEAVSILRKCFKTDPGIYGNDLAKTLLVLAYVFTEQTGRDADVRVCAEEAERAATDEEIKRKARKLIEKYKS